MIPFNAQSDDRTRAIPWANLGLITGLALVRLFTQPELLKPLQRYHLGPQQ